MDKVNAIATITNLAHANQQHRSMTGFPNRVTKAIEACIALDLTSDEARNISYSVMEFLCTDVTKIEKAVAEYQNQKV